MNVLKVVLMRVVNSMLGMSSMFRDMISAVHGLTNAVRDLTDTQIKLAQAQIEDRHAIAELYTIYGEVVTHLSSKAALQPAQLSAKKSTLTPIEQIEADRKKGVLN